MLLTKINEPLSLEQFIKIAKGSQLNPEELEKLITRCEEEVLKGGDPEFRRWTMLFATTI